MPEELLNIIMIVAISVGGAALLAAAIYGAIRKFSRITWIGWQVLLIFGLSVLFGYLPVPAGDVARFIFSLAYAIVAVALPLLLEYILRKVFVKRLAPNMGKPSLGHRFAGRFFGAISSMLAVAALLFVLGGFGLLVAQSYFNVAINVPIWTNFLSGYASDVLLLSLLLIVMRAGLRLGVLKGLYMLLIVLLTLGAFVGSFVFFGSTAPGIGASRTVGSWFPLPTLEGDFLGCAILSVLCFIVAEVLILILAHFIGKGVQKATSVRALAAVDSLIVGILYTVLFLAFVAALFFGISYVQTLGDTLEVAGYAIPLEMVHGAVDKFVGIICSSPLSGSLFVSNPLSAFLTAVLG